MPPLTPETLKLFEGRAIDILIESYSNSARILEVRGMTENQFISHDHTTSSDRSLATSSISITKMPVTLTVKPAAASVSRGECYVKVSLRVDRTIVAILFAGYATDTGPLKYPGGTVKDSIEGPGLIRTIIGTDPAAGVEISETVPTGARWKLISIFFTFIADATVASRVVQLKFDNGTSEIQRLDGSTSITASASREHRAIIGDAPIAVVGTDQFFAIPQEMILAAGYRILTVTSLIQAGDQYNAPILLVEEWIEP